jgi:peptide/nickel transport system substrate-binding protein
VRSSYLIPLAAALLASCRTHDTAEPDALEIVVPTESATLDPRFSTRSLDVKLTRLLHAGVMGLDRNTLAPVPLLARSQRFVNENTLEIELQPGARFHSGQLLRATDVCATLSALADPALGSPHRAVVRAIGTCTATSNHKLRIVLAEPRASLLSDLEVPILRSDQVRLPPRPNGELDGLGPYRVARARPGEVVLEPADTGVLSRPAHAVVVRTVRDENARALRLLAGESDIAPNAISPGLLPALEREDALAVVARAGANVTYLLMHNDRPPFDRLEVRRAVAHAIDRELIVRTMLAGRARVAKGLLPPDHWAAAPELAAEPFAPEAARTVLSTLPSVTLLTSTDRARVTLARVIAQMLRDAGLEVEVVALDLGVLLERLDAGDYLLASLQLPELTEPNVLSWFFHPDKIPGEGSEGKNRVRYRSAEARVVLDIAARVRDPAERRDAYQRFARLVQRDVPVVPLWHEDQIAVVSRRARGFELSAEGRWLSVAGIP